MDWYKRLLDLCHAYDMEPLVGEDGVINLIYAGEEPSFQVKAQVETILSPDKEYRFVHGPRTTIVNEIIRLIRNAGSARTGISFSQNGTMFIESTLKDDHTVWPEVESIAKTDKFIVHIKKKYLDPKNDLRLQELMKLQELAQGLLGVADQSVEKPPFANLGQTPNKPYVPAKLATEIEKNQASGHDISKDDLLNLKIKLGTANTIEDFLETLEGRSK